MYLYVAITNNDQHKHNGILLHRSRRYCYILIGITFWIDLHIKLAISWEPIISLIIINKWQLYILYLYYLLLVTIIQILYSNTLLNLQLYIICNISCLTKYSINTQTQKKYFRTFELTKTKNIVKKLFWRAIKCQSEFLWKTVFNSNEKVSNEYHLFWSRN